MNLAAPKADAKGNGMTFFKTPALIGLLATTALPALSAAPASAQELTSALTYAVVGHAEDGTETLTADVPVRPGDVIEYKIAHVNGTEDDVSGLAVALPVPEGVTVALGAESSSLPATFEVQAELDPMKPGLEWSTLPAMRDVIEADGQIRREPLPADQIEAVRWILQAALPSGETALNAYRVTVD